MLPTTKLIDKLEKFKSNGIDLLLVEAFESSKKKIIQLNTIEQLYKKGVDNQNKAIEPPYTPLTVSIKKKKGQPSNRVTLKDTGDFYKATDVDFGAKKFTITNFDDKYEKLSEKYGDEILGLTLESQAILKDIIIKKIKKKINKLI